ncbi:hypothetical protein OH76DRAFT_1190076 [Lentinus brumalis]|uniref:Uncharacterized protein n=1 Tax=Lentinus brumalis TaxID=2498619 RepID=A0A371CTJ0_9APHY|nr:hypothetical protein OH76DRAFT_1190076 [Polyporus brumalis]
MVSGPNSPSHPAFSIIVASEGSYLRPPHSLRGRFSRTRLFPDASSRSDWTGPESLGVGTESSLSTSAIRDRRHRRATLYDYVSSRAHRTRASRLPLAQTARFVDGSNAQREKERECAVCAIGSGKVRRSAVTLAFRCPFPILAAVLVRFPRIRPLAARMCDPTRRRCVGVASAGLERSTSRSHVLFVDNARLPTYRSVSWSVWTCGTCGTFGTQKHCNEPLEQTRKERKQRKTYGRLSEWRVCCGGVCTPVVPER